MSGFELLILLLMSQTAPQSAPAYPDFQNIRVEEDWNVLAGQPRNDLWEKLKFIPLNQQESSFLSLGGQLRLRGEAWDDFGFASGGTRDDRFGLFRLRAHADLHLGSHVRGFVEGKSALSSGRDLPGGNRTLDVDSADFQQALLELAGSAGDLDVKLRLGRQELQFGRQRLVSPLDWSNTRPRAFDGVRLTTEPGGWRVDGFWAKHVSTKKYSLNSSDDSKTDFFGLYGTRQGAQNWTVEGYWLGLRRERSIFSNASGKELRHTLGGRLNGSYAPGGDLEIEAAYQFGDIAEQEIKAAMFTAVAGYQVAARYSVRLYSGFDFASGDGEAGDGRLGTFNQLFPLGHAYFGHIDMVARQNILDWNYGLSGRPHGRWNVAVAMHHFWRASRHDALYNAGGGIVRPGLATAARGIGQELDVTTSFRCNRFLTIGGGYGHFFAGPFLRDTGPDEDIDLFHVSVTHTF